MRGIGSDGRVRQHMTGGGRALLSANPAPEVVSFADHSIDIAGKLQRHGRAAPRGDRGQPRTARAALERSAALSRGHGGLGALVPQPPRKCSSARPSSWCKEEPAETDEQATREAIFARVARTIERARKGERSTVTARSLRDICKGTLEPPPVVLLVAPTGSRKSTLMRAAAVQYVTEHPKKTVVILMPRHGSVTSRSSMLQQEHPDGGFSAAVWRGRHAWDPDVLATAREEKMCRRSEEAEELEEAMLNVEQHLCKQREATNAARKEIKCPLYDGCAYQRQKQIKANIWFAAHECAVHEMPKAFGDVGWVIFDESPLDAFMFGVDHNDDDRACTRHATRLDKFRL